MDAVIDDPEHIADVLEAAADFIDVHGWTQGSKGNYPQFYGPACINGAIRAVAKNENVNVYDNRYVATVRVALDGRTPHAWNDEDGREQWEVTELLRDTAKKVRHGDLVVAS